MKCTLHRLAALPASQSLPPSGGRVVLRSMFAKFSSRASSTVASMFSSTVSPWVSPWVSPRVSSRVSPTVAALMAALVVPWFAPLATLLPVSAAFANSPPVAIARPALVPLPPRLVVQGAEMPIRLDSVAVTTQVTGRLAQTSVELVFFNPNNRQLEGELQFPLLEGQEVTGFAMDFNGRLREAVPVEKARGQAVFEDITRARVDPALAEKTEIGRAHV